MTATSPRTQVPLWRRLLAGAAGLLGAIVLAVSVRDPDDALMLAIPVVSPVIAALFVHRRSLGAQLLARAIWWSNLVFGAFLCFGRAGGQRIDLAITLGSGLALLFIGRRGLAEASERAALIPAAFRSSLLLLMVLALADAQSLALFAILELDRSVDGGHALALGALAFTVGFIGLYRLAIWGVLVNAAAAITLSFMIVTGSIKLTRDFDTLVLLLTGAQVLVVAPMLVALALGKPLPALPPRVRALLAPIAIVTLMAVSISVGLYRRGL